MAWIILFVAGLAEIAWLTAMKYSHGFTKLVPTAVFVVFTVLSMVLLSQSLKYLPTGTAYAVWTGIGAAGGAVVGILVFGDPVTPGRLICIGLIVAGVVGLKLAT